MNDLSIAMKRLARIAEKSESIWNPEMRDAAQ